VGGNRSLFLRGGVRGLGKEMAWCGNDMISQTLEGLYSAEGRASVQVNRLLILRSLVILDSVREESHHQCQGQGSRREISVGKSFCYRCTTKPRRQDQGRFNRRHKSPS